MQQENFNSGNIFSHTQLCATSQLFHCLKDIQIVTELPHFTFLCYLSVYGLLSARVIYFNFLKNIFNKKSFITSVHSTSKY